MNRSGPPLHSASASTASGSTQQSTAQESADSASLFAVTDTVTRLVRFEPVAAETRLEERLTPKAMVRNILLESSSLRNSFEFSCRQLHYDNGRWLRIHSAKSGSTLTEILYDRLTPLMQAVNSPAFENMMSEHLIRVSIGGGHSVIKFSDQMLKEYGDNEVVMEALINIYKDVMKAHQEVVSTNSVEKHLYLTINDKKNLGLSDNNNTLVISYCVLP